MRLERKQHSQSVGNDQQHRQSHAQLVSERRCRCGVGLRDSRRNQQRDRREEEQTRLHACADPVVFLYVVLEAAEEK